MLRLDPYAVAAVSLAEGGGRFGAVGDGGTSYGPFQLHVGGALPPGRNAAWANSPDGVLYAMQHMASSGAAGLHGLSAIRAIVTRFERPAAPGAEVARAWGTYRGADTGNYQVGPVGNGTGMSMKQLNQQMAAYMKQSSQQMMQALQAQAAQTRQQGLAQAAAQQLFQRHQAAAQAQSQLTGQSAARLADPTRTLAEQNRQKTQDLREQALRRAGIA